MGSDHHISAAGSSEEDSRFASLVQHMSRRTSGRKLIREIDGLRSVAIVSVVMFHAAETFRLNAGDQLEGAGGLMQAILATGEYGVPLFFVISGFILALPFAEWMSGGKPISLVKYVTRRVTRLEPPYFVALLVAFVIVSIELGSMERWTNLLASMFYVHNIAFWSRSEVLPVAWSLEVEIQFYVLMPLLAFVYMIKPAWVRRGVLVAGILVLSLTLAKEKPIWGRTVLHQGGFFLAGLLLADLYRNKWFGDESELGSPPRPATLFWDVVALLALAGTFAVRGLDWYPQVLAPWLILVGFAGVFRGSYIRRWFRWTPVVILGGMCYTTYLWHYLMMRTTWPIWEQVFAPDPTPLSMLLYVLVATVSSFAVTAILFMVIERPTMDPRWPQKLWGLVAGGRERTASV